MAAKKINYSAKLIKGKDYLVGGVSFKKNNAVIIDEKLATYLKDNPQFEINQVDDANVDPNQPPDPAGDN